MDLDNPDHKELYRERTQGNKEFFERAKKVTPLGVESNVRHFDPYPIYVNRAEGSYVYDVDGNEYLDFLMALGPKILGHNHPAVTEAVKEQAERADLTATPQVISIELMEKIVDWVPSIEKVRLTNSGSEATMHALRVARSYTGNDKIAKPEGGYGGAHDYLLQSVLADEDALGDEKRPNTVSYGSGIPDQISDLTVAFPFNDKEATEEILREHADDLAAVIIEPVMFSAGCLKPQDGYHEFLRDLTDELDIVLIWDEVMTGFRLAPGGAQERFGIEPDMTTFAKAVGGGYQMAGFGGTADIMNEIIPPDESNAQESWQTTAFHGGTYNGHPVSAAASLKTLEVLEEEDVYADIDRKGELLFDGLQDVIDDVGIPAHVEYIGSAGQVLMMDDDLDGFRDLFGANGDQFNDWFVEAAARGVLFGIPPQGERFFTAYSHTEDEIERALEVAEDAFKAVDHEYDQ
ncbi:glutamate-1-semialdehyde aminotransferase [Natrinema pellirubrum DSM 15624]|uniref:Glutamate-1-semialdehyde 2,1-aminomutase n=1 Tax=Natrinema pellirubrum (strain DSM 15624 / CIP 106293 / JCM 10476 / NCIMB 786 / 157) TaxID=797303 RepID=L0JM24_NATP1|nr:aspartate aminotransferase family protein [Natrinema pellirubrum]AGB32299.1 glutamate-1-semialdehyde aminotransferase [Natrinema pellirubrum DSM 15624]ELY74663.1 glutamate-1-semialdehyde aminotransferase [Natrinema pellirubrum DSM 15624]